MIQLKKEREHLTGPLDLGGLAESRAKAPLIRQTKEEVNEGLSLVTLSQPSPNSVRDNDINIEESATISRRRYLTLFFVMLYIFLEYFWSNGMVGVERVRPLTAVEL